MTARKLLLSLFLRSWVGDDASLQYRKTSRLNGSICMACSDGWRLELKQGMRVATYYCGKKIDVGLATRDDVSARGLSLSYGRKMVCTMKLGASNTIN